MSQTGDQLAEQSLYEVAHGDPGTMRMLRESLQRLATQSRSAELREMAQSVLDGRITLRRAALSRAYGSALSEHAEAFARQYQAMTAEERTALAVEGRRELQRLAQQEAEEQAGRSVERLSD